LQLKSAELKNVRITVDDRLREKLLDGMVNRLSLNWMTKKTQLTFLQKQTFWLIAWHLSYRMEVLLKEKSLKEILR